MQNLPWITKFFSRKLTLSLLAIIGMIEGTMRVVHSGLGEPGVIIVAPILIVGISVVCVTYLTGQAKIDVQMQSSLK